LDSSAVLAFLQGEPGAKEVAANLEGSVIGAANLAEVLQRFDSPAEARIADALITAKGVSVEPVTKSDAFAAASMHHERKGLSLGDRLCLALAERLDARVLTADRDWGSSQRIRQIR
jgi:ribonuclease VapC